MKQWYCDKCDTKVKLHPAIKGPTHICGKRRTPVDLKEKK